MSFKKNFYQSVSTFAVYNYLSQGLEFLATIVLSRLLVPEEYGLVAIIHIFAGFIGLFSNVGIGHSLIRSDYKYTFHKHLYSVSIWMGLTLALIMMLLSYPISIFFDNRLLIVPTLVISIKFIFDSFLYVPYAILAKALNFNLIGKIKLIATSIQIGLTIIMAYLGFSYWSLIIPLIIHPLIQFAYLRKHVKMPMRLYGRRSTLMILNKIKSLMGNLSLINLLSYWTSNVDKVVVGRLYTQADLGIYNRAYKFINLTFYLISGIFGSVLFPSLKKLMESKGDVQKEYLDIIRVVALFTLPIVFILVVLPQTLVLLLWGNAWTGVSPLLPYIGIMLLFNSLINTTPSVFILFKRERTLFFVNLANSAITIALVIAGGFISMVHILKFLALGQLLITLPIYLYFGFYKSFGFKPRAITGFFFPSIIFGILLFASVEFFGTAPKLIIIAGFAAFLLFELRSSVSQGFLIIRRLIFSSKE